MLRIFSNQIRLAKMDEDSSVQQTELSILRNEVESLKSGASAGDHK